MHLVVAGETRKAMGEQGRRFVEQHYSKTRLLEDVATLYSELTEKDKFQVSGSRTQVSRDSSTIDIRP